jgi:hypothetical protein
VSRKGRGDTGCKFLAHVGEGLGFRVQGLGGVSIQLKGFGPSEYSILHKSDKCDNHTPWTGNPLGPERRQTITHGLAPVPRKLAVTTV